ncbi:ABC transporter substrate-binding protein, partial [Paraburkholderia tropica]
LFVYSSHQLDPVAAKITNSMTNNSMKLALAEGLKQSDFIDSKGHDEDHEHHSHHEESNQDPHVWLDPVLNQKFAFMIKEKLIEKDPKHQAYYNKNYKMVNKDIVHIDQQLQSITKHSKRDKVVISHDSLGYLAHRYGFKQQGVKGMNDEEPSQKEILNIVKDIQHSHAPYVLYEQNITS